MSAVADTWSPTALPPARGSHDLLLRYAEPLLGAVGATSDNLPWRNLLAQRVDIASELCLRLRDVSAKLVWITGHG